jgi:hypothetical protein
VRALLERHPRHRTAHAAVLTDILDVLAGSSLPAPAGRRPELREDPSERELRVLRSHDWDDARSPAGPRRSRHGRTGRTRALRASRAWLLSEALLGAFPSLHAQADGAETVLAGELPDQAALYGMLTQIEAFGLELLEVRRQRA